MAFELGNVFRNKKIPTIFGIIVLLLGVVAGVVVVSQQANLSLFTKAGPTATPRQVRISNISETGFTVSWVSDTSVSGFVKYGLDAAKLDKTFGDDRDRTSGKTGLFTTHFVTISGLKPNTAYYFSLGSGSTNYTDSGKPYTVKTAKTAAKPAADTVSGKVLLASGQPASGAIVYVELEGGAPLAALTKASGAWSLSLSASRTKDLEGYLQYDKQTAKENIFVQAAELGTASLTTTTGEDSPVADITLGKTQDLATLPNTNNAKTVIVITNKTVAPTDVTVLSGQTVTVMNNDTVDHMITAKGNEFKTPTIKAGSSGTFVAPVAPGKYNFYDSLNPQLESLVGTITVSAQVADNALPGAASNPSAVAAIPTIGITAAPTATPTATPTTAVGGTASATSGASLVSVVSILEGEKIATDSPEITVKGPVGTKVKITVNSAVTQTKEITLDADGLVTWTPPSDLEPGEHTVTLEYTDSAGKLQKVTKKFTVLAAATPTPTTKASTLLTTPTYSATKSAITKTPTSTTSGRTSMPSTASAMPEAGVLTPTLILSTLGIALLLLGLGFQVRFVPENIYK
jgi:plastocyanin